MAEELIKQMTAEASKLNVDYLVKRMEEKVDCLKIAFQQSTTDSVNGGRPTRQDAGDATFMLRTNTCGEISRLPPNFQFPKGGCDDCWIQWNVGNGKRQIPPLSKLGRREFVFIDNIPKMDAEKRSQSGKYKDKQQPSR